MMAFHVGQKVEYVGGVYVPWIEFIWQMFHPYKGLKKKTPYTVSKVYVDYEGWTMLEVLEHPSPETKDYQAGWIAKCFRPIIEKKTDTGMAILQEILDRETIKDDVPVKKPSKVQ